MSKYSIFLMLLFCFLFFACKKNYTPKPRGYFRIDFPQKKYIVIKNDYPFSFEIPQYVEIEEDNSAEAKPNWINLIMDDYNCKIHISYYAVNKNLDAFTEDAHVLAFKHTIKADAIKRKEFVNEDKNIYAMLYDIEGNAASNIQFTATDDRNHFLRGALYFNMRPNVDSIKPIIDFVREDIIHLLETLEWKHL